MKEMICCVKAIPFYIKTGIWCPHIYAEVERYSGIVIATKNGFRISNTFIHRENERVHPKAMIIHNKCVCCGKEDISWYDREPFILSD